MQTNSVSKIITALKNTLLIFVILAMLSFTFWCVLIEYTRVHLSSWAYLKRLAHPTGEIQTESDVLHILKERIPVGTSSSDIQVYLESRGIESDRFVGGQFYRYQVTEHEVLAILSDPPWAYSLFCSHNNYFVRFVLNPNGKLEDIIINRSGACL